MIIKALIVGVMCAISSLIGAKAQEKWDKERYEKK